MTVRFVYVKAVVRQMFVQLSYVLLSGLTLAMAGFLVAAGLTLVFGVLKILNFAHGAFFMIGAYVTRSIVGATPSIPLWLGASLVGGLAVGLAGLITDLIVFRRLKGVDSHYSLIATFAVLLVVTGLAKLIWGVDFHSMTPPPPLDATWTFGNFYLPVYSLFVIAAGILVFVLLDWATHRSVAGKLVQSVAHDPWMSNVLGVNAQMIITAAVIVSFALAGLAGGLLLPNQSLSPSLADVFLLFAFNAVILGGLGNVRGAFLASLVLGLMESASSVLLPKMPSISLYVALIVFILIRPQGLFSLPESTGEPPPPARLSAQLKVPAALGLLVLAAVVALPFLANDSVTFIAGLALIEGLFALSWNLLFRYAGIASFGHAAFFALGAYGVGAALKFGWHIHFLLLLTVAALVGAVTALAIGAVALKRVSGIHFAILTLAVAEVLRIVISNSIGIGGDEGLAGIPRPTVDVGVGEISLASSHGYYLFILTVVVASALALRWLTLSETGRALRSIAQDPERAAFLGIDVFRFRLLAFTLAGAVAALCGGLSAPWVQITTPDLTHWLHSAQPMLNTLLGGASFFWGPLIGAGVFAGLSYATRTMAGASELAIGFLLLTIILVAPSGISGALGAAQARLRDRLAGRRRPGATQVRAK